MKLSDYIKQYRKEHNLSLREFAARCEGVTHGYLSMLEHDLNPSTGKPIVPSIGTLASIAAAMGMTLHQLCLEVDDMTVILPSEKARNELPRNLTPISQMRHHYVPMLGGVAAGEPILCETNYDMVIDAPKKADYALRIEGDSMSPRFEIGDIVYVHAQDDVDDGQIAVVLIDDSATVKKVYHMDSGLMLISENHLYKPMLINASEHDCIRILGKVCGFTRMF